MFELCTEVLSVIKAVLNSLSMVEKVNDLVRIFPDTFFLHGPHCHYQYRFSLLSNPHNLSILLIQAISHDGKIQIIVSNEKKKDTECLNYSRVKPFHMVGLEV